MHRRDILRVTVGGIAATLASPAIASSVKEATRYAPTILISSLLHASPGMPVPVWLAARAPNSEGKITSIELLAVGTAFPGIARFVPPVPSGHVSLRCYVQVPKDGRLGIKLTMVNRPSHLELFQLMVGSG